MFAEKENKNIVRNVIHRACFTLQYQKHHCIHQRYYSKTDIHTMFFFVCFFNNYMLETYSAAFSIYIPLLASEKILIASV